MALPTYPVTVDRRYPAAPLVGVAAVVLNSTGQVLLVQRGHPPAQGEWGLPGGLLDLGERLVDGVRREVYEECGVEVEVMDLIAAFEPIQRDTETRVEYHFVVLDYWALYLSGKPVAQDDAAAVAWSTRDEWLRYDLSPETFDVVARGHERWLAHKRKSPDR